MAKANAFASCLALQLSATACSRDAFFIAAFVFLLFVVAVALSGDFASVKSLIHAEWISVLIGGFAVYFIQTQADEERSAAFQSMGMGRLYRVTLFLALLLLMCPILIAWIVIGLLTGCFCEVALASLVMLLFSCSLFSGVLLARTVMEAHRLPRSLHLLIAAPWTLIAWLFGGFCTDAIILNENLILPLGVLCVCGVWSTTMWSCRK